jgi:hypothetical protein
MHSSYLYQPRTLRMTMCQLIDFCLSLHFQQRHSFMPSVGLEEMEVSGATCPMGAGNLIAIGEDQGRTTYSKSSRRVHGKPNS